MKQRGLVLNCTANGFLLFWVLQDNWSIKSYGKVNVDGIQSTVSIKPSTLRLLEKTGKAKTQCRASHSTNKTTASMQRTYNIPQTKVQTPDENIFSTVSWVTVAKDARLDCVVRRYGCAATDDRVELLEYILDTIIPCSCDWCWTRAKGHDNVDEHTSTGKRKKVPE